MRAIKDEDMILRQVRLVTWQAKQGLNIEALSTWGTHRDARRTRTSRTRRFRSTVAVPVPFQVCFNYLYGRWTDSLDPSKTVKCMSVMAVKMVGRVSLKLQTFSDRSHGALRRDVSGLRS
jgi:hypothetical protein